MLPSSSHLSMLRTDCVVQPQDAIDFTDNDIQVLGNLPLSPRLKTLLLARNRVSSIQPSVVNSIPNLTNLVLSSNNFTELADLDPLSKFLRLTHLTLMENPVTNKEVGFKQNRCGSDKFICTNPWKVLSILGHFSMPNRPIPGLSKGQGCRTQESRRAVWKHS